MSDCREWPEDESRIDAIGQNGNCGHHYKTSPKLSKGQYRIVPNQWGEEEVRSLVKMHKSKLKVKEMARHLNCDESRIKNKLHRLGYSMKGLM